MAFVAQYFDELPPVVQRRLKNVPDRPPMNSSLIEDPAAFRTALVSLRVATGKVDEAEFMDALFDLRRSDPARAVQLLRLWRDPRALPWLIGFVLGDHAVARADAAHAVIQHADRWPTELVDVVPALARLTELSEGCYGALALAEATRTSRSEVSQEFRRILCKHPSAKVRSALGTDEP
jgi:hypothetical protein